MTFKRFTRLALILALFAGLVSAISAEDDGPRQTRFGNGVISSILQDATGLDAAGLREALQAGASPAELIEANGGDVDAVIDAALAESSSAIERAKAARIAELSDRITAWVNGEGGTVRQRLARLAIKGSAIQSILQEATGLDAAGLREALAAGASSAELIEANGGDVAAVIDAALAEASSAIEGAEAARTAELSDRITAWVNGEGGMVRQRLAIGGSAIQSILEEATGLDAAGLREALAAGASPTELIEANGGEVNAVMDALVAEATKTMERMRTRLDEMGSGFGEMLRKVPRGIWGRRWHWGRRG